MKETIVENPAEMYQHYFVPSMFRAWTEILLRHAAPRPGERVLDVACGPGTVARAVAAIIGEEGRVDGIDVSPAMLDVARGLPDAPGASVIWHQGSAVALPFPDGAFELALCQQGLQFFPDRLAAVREMRRVLTSAGRAVAAVWQELTRHPVWATLLESVAKHFPVAIDDVTAPFSLSDASVLADLYASAGFEKVVVIPETTTAVFDDADRFVSLALLSAAAAVPALAQVLESDRTEITGEVEEEVRPILRKYRDGAGLRFPMHANIVVAT